MNTDEKLENWRKQIDELDSELIHILAKRIQVVMKIGEYKKAHNISPLDEKRWNELLKSRLSKAGLLNVPKYLVKIIYEHIHRYSLEIESKK